jgi:hypothetical protein
MLIGPCIGGFTQHEGLWNGVMEARETLLAEFDDYSSLAVRFPFYTWNSPWKKIASEMYLLRERYRKEKFTVVAFAFSYGVGNGLIKLAKRLDRYGIEIDCAVLCDGIFRHWFTPAQWRIIWGDTRIRLPGNIKSYYGFYQDIETPKGRKPVSDTAVCLGWERLHLPHVEMDDSWKFREKCVEIARQYAPKKATGPASVPTGAPQTAALESRIANP